MATGEGAEFLELDRGFGVAHDHAVAIDAHDLGPALAGGRRDLGDDLLLLGGIGLAFAAGGKGERAHRGQEDGTQRSEEHTSELQSLMRISYAVFCLKKKKQEHA